MPRSHLGMERHLIHSEVDWGTQIFSQGKDWGAGLWVGLGMNFRDVVGLWENSLQENLLLYIFKWLR